MFVAVCFQDLVMMMFGFCVAFVFMLGLSWRCCCVFVLFCLGQRPVFDTSKSLFGSFWSFSLQELSGRIVEIPGAGPSLLGLRRSLRPRDGPGG